MLTSDEIIMDKVLIEVYGAEGRVQDSFLPAVQTSLENIASIADDLDSCFPLSDTASGATISRAAANSQLFYRQVH